MLPVRNAETLFGDFKLSRSHRFGDISQNTLRLKSSDPLINCRPATRYIGGDRVFCVFFPESARSPCSEHQ
ncbi:MULTISPECIES: hypothetical protein [unclassified Microcoleus]|uniref:hypothetical protein n=1 Tax=unclassified Microcoleus TaxID=2642155 RepID=UPI001DF67AD8|nr:MULTISPECIES: hypothetical protein [unclassified Microcoleus]MCC3445488.1 hypothetical protein [Microcoleus sp. PH2017_03_ELD_O_A]TAE11758.1 MAG: hypothetical protein EAZ94_14815 [Oscillatoriales cyanobacterium]MCC3414817.1 hypothetical protein [Microcoleus sp. PH2017_02_FOX_O_A]MCC3423336.1 hypothetical protein [Microcoleus sp. PH2017_01_SCD_O_A]MCC3439810.1 hypothetical protein [Microcoleus sp. PH2017_05_CCC_O_A]